MSAGSRDLLSDLIAEFERSALAANKIRSERIETEEELNRELDEAGIRVARLGERDRLIAMTIREEGSEEEPGRPPEPNRIVEVVPLVFKVDLFG